VAGPFDRQFAGLTVFRFALEGCLFFLTLLAARLAHARAADAESLWAAIAFAVVMLTIHASFGLYRAGEVTALGNRLVRACSAVVVGGLIAFVAFQLFPNSGQHQNALGAALLLTVAASLGLQLASRAATALDMRSQRILVLGTGPDALRVENLLASREHRRSRVVGFYSVNAEAPAVPAARVLSRDVPLEQAVRDLNVSHVVVALREQRGGALPVSQLLSCRLQGVQVIDVPRLFESMADRCRWMR
jgi:FlaA1/EpsC-like NDP-sugar epimerase